MAAQPTNSCHVTIRLTPAVRKKFMEKARRHGRASEVLRELVTAFVENRVTITPPVNPKEPLYVTGK